MFYRPEEGHGLPHNPFKAVVTPRPIGWISSRGAAGDNLAPYSFFNAVADEPPQVMFCSLGTKPKVGGDKDSVAQIRETGVFCVNIVSHALLGPMNVSSGPWARGEDEFAMAGLEKAECETIDCARVAAAPASLECRLDRIVTLKGENNLMVLGTVTGVHLRDEFVVEGRFDLRLYEPVARLGYRDYAKVSETFELKRPGQT